MNKEKLVQISMEILQNESFRNIRLFDSDRIDDFVVLDINENYMPLDIFLEKLAKKLSEEKENEIKK